MRKNQFQGWLYKIYDKFHNHLTKKERKCLVRKTTEQEHLEFFIEQKNQVVSETSKRWNWTALKFDGARICRTGLKVKLSSNFRSYDRPLSFIGNVKFEMHKKSEPILYDIFSNIKRHYKNRYLEMTACWISSISEICAQILRISFVGFTMIAKLLEPKS